MSQIRTIGIIMDGNRRFAKEKGLSAFEGHRRGAEKLREVLKWSRAVGVHTVIAYAFSTENLKRNKMEVSFLFKLFRQFLKKEIETLVADKTIFRCVGERKFLPTNLPADINLAEARTKNLGPHTLALLVAYGGRAEILEAAKVFALRHGGNLATATESDFSHCLATAGLPDPDLIIRTGGENRLSNFLPWQSVYSELAFTLTLWPALTREEFTAILREAATRERRFGR